MRELAFADRVEILVLVDNVTDSLSTGPEFAETEFRRYWRRGGRILSGQCLCCAAHGLSCAITAWRGDISRTLLFDTGPETSVFERNVERLGFDMGTVDGIVLSHGHWDHGGAMLRALEMIQMKNGGREVPTCFPGQSLHGVMGGFHLAGSTEQIIPDTVDALRAFNLETIMPAHCTGWRATGALTAAFGHAVIPSAVGKTFRL